MGRLRQIRQVVFIGAIALGVLGQGRAQSQTGLQGLKGYDPGGGVGKEIRIASIEGTIDLGLAPLVERVIEGATSEDVVVLKIKTFGGRVDAAVRIRDALLASAAPTVAYIDRRAISAGALIALACDTIIMSEGASMGAATPVTLGQSGEMQPTSEKVVSYMRAEMRATAEAKGRRGDIAEAMVDPDIEIKGVDEKGKLLTLTGERALELKIADAVVHDFEAALGVLNLGGATRVETDTHWAEKLARILTDPMLSSLLMTFGVMGLLVELYTPGFGFPGVIGLICLGLFFLGQFAANLAGAEEAILFVAGGVLLALEIFVFPGFGVAGIAGIVCVVVALAMSLMELKVPLDVSFELGYIQEAITQTAIRLGMTLVMLVIGVIVLGRMFPRQASGWLVFKAKPTGAGQAGLGAEAHGASLPTDFADLVGKQGLAITVLRPAGVVDIDGQRIHVVAEGEYVEAGARLTVTRVDGSRVIVRRTPKE